MRYNLQVTTTTVIRFFVTMGRYQICVFASTTNTGVVAEAGRKGYQSQRTVNAMSKRSVHV